MSEVSFETETVICWLENFHRNLKKAVSPCPSHEACGCEELSKRISHIQQNLQRGLPLSKSESSLIYYLLSDHTPLEEPSLLSFITQQLRDKYPALLQDIQKGISAKGDPLSQKHNITPQSDSDQSKTKRVKDALIVSTEVVKKEAFSTLELHGLQVCFCPTALPK